MTKIMRPEEAATFLGVSVGTLARWAHEEKVPFFRTLGGHRRYHLHELTEIRDRWSLTINEVK